MTLSRKLFLLALPLLGGCLTASVPDAASWTIEFAGSASAPIDPARSRGNVRLAHVSVRAPYDNPSISVQRADGSVASDPYNQFAAQPSSLLRGVILDAFRATDTFGTAVSASSQLTADFTVEVTVRRLLLDCREKGRRRATAEVAFLLMKDRAVVSVSSALAQADADDGNYTRAFSQAFSQAVTEAIRNL